MNRSATIDFKAIYKLGEALRDFIVETTIKISRVRTVSYNPADFSGQGPDGMDMPGHESRVVEILEPILGSWGIAHFREAKIPERPALFASIGRREPGKRHLMFLLHTDTVPSGTADAWKFAPFEAHEKGGKLYGRGVLDNKGPLAATLAAIKILKEHEHHVPGTVTFAAVPDEEVGAGYGLDWLLSTGKLTCDEAVVPDIAGQMKEINVAEKGRLVLRLKAHGKAAHAMEPSKGVSAIYGLAAALAKIEKLKMPHTKHKLLGSPTLNLGLVRGGSAPNAVADLAEAVLDIRYVPGQSIKAIIGQIKRVADAEAKKRRGLRFDIEAQPGSTAPIAVSPKAPIVQAVLRHAPRAKIVGTGGGTFAHSLVERGIDAVGWAPGEERTYHQPNEEIAVAELTSFAGRLAALTLDRMNEA